MLIMCKGNCGKKRTAQPYKSTRVVFFLCASCATKYATRTKRPIIIFARYPGINIMKRST